MTIASSSSCVLLNCRSICNKASEISDFISDRRMDFLCLTETWLTGTEEDKVVSAALLPDDYAMVHRPRDARGGGVAFIHRRSITLSQIRLGDYSSFEVLDALVCTARRLRMCVVYRPPPSRRNNLTVAQFMSEFADFLSDIVSLPGEPLIVGDFNFHLDDCGDADASTFSDLLTSFGLKQHVRGPTHEKGHTLDLCCWTNHIQFFADQHQAGGKCSDF
ncbi:hypothetical protein CAPTEDRAFT_185599 [Capitella teleta]|uniref:Endonuclease/exonuclease/phosphatase domain-containing protein n=1 Tax=Capitella teleta TaxID=283909 RepID=R7V289_CAPTE|nr:hypothetical protein CAPTEDRAFT_185599 [Capitella teleta]|eukprot:ELU12644.1 hypothetical protein CAPTEDRAFT_185599 [Capitella teleta]